MLLLNFLYVLCCFLSHSTATDTSCLYDTYSYAEIDLDNEVVYKLRDGKVHKLQSERPMIIITCSIPKRTTGRGH